MAGIGGIDTYTKLLLHCDGTDQGVSFSDSASGGKTVTNTAAYDAYTKLLIHFDGADADAGDQTAATGQTITTAGTAQLDTAKKKFGTASMLLDGDSDFFSVPDSADWVYGTGDFTIDLWANFNHTTANQFIVQQGATANREFQFFYGSGRLNFFAAKMDGTAILANYYITWTPTQGVWYHIALVRNNTDIHFFIDGVLQSKTTTNAISTNSLEDYDGALVFGKFVNTGSDDWFFNGQLDEIRISKGIARWTSSFTPYRSAYGQVATITADKKFGTACAEIHGSGDFLSLEDSADWNFADGAFTIDCWIKLLEVGGGNYCIWSQGTDVDNLFRAYIATNGTLYAQLYVGAASIFSIESAGFVKDTWYHIAFVRSANAWSLYRNGVLQNYASSAQTYPDFTGTFRVGISPAGTLNFNGLIEEFRVSKGVARWTNNFNPIGPYDTFSTKQIIYVQR